MTMKINLMKNYIGEENIGSPLCQGTDYNAKGKKHSNALLALGTAAIFGYTSLFGLPAVHGAEKAAPQKIALKTANASIPKNKVNILVKKFEESGDQVERKYVGRAVYSSSGNDGLIIREAIKQGLYNGEKMGTFNIKGNFVVFDDTEIDYKEADLVIKGIFYRSGSKIYFFTDIFDKRANKTIYRDEEVLPDTPNSVLQGGRIIAAGIDNFLD